LILKKSPKERI